MQVILNIGLARAGKDNLDPAKVERALWSNGIATLDAKIVESDTEPTLVIRTADITARNEAGNKFVDWVYNVSVALEQDCIAAYLPAFNMGQLIGPRAAAWGEFNPEFFFNIDGQRLA
jgi:hypothetical protein